MTLSDQRWQVHCPACGWQGIWGPAQLLDGLHEIQILRREKQPDEALVVQLAKNAADRLLCRHCHHSGLQITAWNDDFDDSIRRVCEICREVIPVERLEVFPMATRCAACQDKPTQPRDEEDFCPRCGEVLQLRLSNAAHVSRYRITCPACGWKG